MFCVPGVSGVYSAAAALQPSLSLCRFLEMENTLEEVRTRTGIRLGSAGVTANKPDLMHRAEAVKVPRGYLLQRELPRS